MTTDYYIAEQQLARTYHDRPEYAWMLPDPDATIDRVCLDVDLGGDEPVDMIILSDGRVVVVGLYDGSIVAQIFAILDDAHYSVDGIELTEV